MHDGEIGIAKRKAFRIIELVCAGRQRRRRHLMKLLLAFAASDRMPLSACALVQHNGGKTQEYA